MTQDFSVRIPRSRWIELLDGVGRAVGITLRIPSPLTDPGIAAKSVNDPTVASLTQAAARLRDARRQLRDQQWEQSVATCRKVLENVAMINPMPTSKEVNAVAPRSRDKRLRWAATFQDVLSLTHAAAHDEGTKISYDAVDAEAILAATASLLRTYSRPKS
jgi:hypothetical protein